MNVKQFRDTLKMYNQNLIVFVETCCGVGELNINAGELLVNGRDTIWGTGKPVLVLLAEGMISEKNKKTVTVKQLEKMLSKYKQDLQVYIETCDSTHDLYLEVDSLFDANKPTLILKADA